MSVMERRLQLLLDQDRYQRVAAEAERRGGSVASVIREAIDVAFPSERLAQQRALEGWLLRTAEPAAEAVSWEDSREAMERELVERFQ